ncbi:MAG: cytochrome c oxidase assembly protein [Mycobacteriaceae bacterium]|nr:cytochrome c oxidase assembly protein [Mycobacteriaceae bacterium]
MIGAGPLTWSTAALSWTWDTVSAVLLALVSVTYVWAYRRRRGDLVVQRGRPWSFGVGVALWAVAAFSVVGVYAYVLFWMRALQVLLLLMVAPFFIAMGRPVTVLRAALGTVGRHRIDQLLGSRLLRVLAHPLTTSVAMLATPWLLYLTPWYVASLEHVAVGALTRVFLVVVGFGYFYARLQTDPVPRRYSQLVSVVISVFETIGDGLLGLVLWLGPLLAVEYYQKLGRDWGPSQRVDQSIGAGILWILGDVLGVPFLIVLFRAFGADERARAAEVDRELDRRESDARTEHGQAQGESTLWWHNDPQLRERFGRR